MKGVYLILASSLCFALMGMFARFRGTVSGSWENVFYRSLFTVLVLGPLFLWRTFREKQHSGSGGKPVLLISRGISGTFSLFLFFYMIQDHSLGLAVTSVQTSPIYIAVYELFFKSEKPTLSVIFSILAGFTGILLIFQGVDLVSFAIPGILCGLSTAYSYNSLREMRGVYSSQTIVLVFCVVGSIIPFILSWISGISFFAGNTAILLPRNSEDFFYIIAIGFLALTGQIFLTRGYTYIPASEASALGYSYVVFALVIEFLYEEKIPRTSQWLGTFLIVMSGIIIAFKNKKALMKEFS